LAYDFGHGRRLAFGTDEFLLLLLLVKLRNQEKERLVSRKSQKEWERAVEVFS
jgi:hypothetical protein